MLTDYHTHTFRCGHAVGTMQEYVEEAIAKGIDEIGLTDHLWLYFDPPERRDPRWAMPEDQYERHYAEMLEVRERYRGRIAVRVSVEADYIEGREDDLIHILERFDFDYVLLGVHFIDEWMIDDPEQSHRYGERSVAAIYREYYRRMRKAVGLGVANLVSHFDLPKKFGDLPEESVGEVVEETLDVVAEAGTAIEISSAGLRNRIGEIYPSAAILSEMKRREIPVAISSDAHAPRDVGFGFDRLLKAAHDAGYRKIATFENRTMRLAELG
ncbi:MAG TPA: histidinol-phosphatase HisJ family protein [Thermoanaerobaculia bacterium]|nr:histidinol-phosphatase HisJ family protein [Thermoanaerobaculia bacterium]